MPKALFIWWSALELPPAVDLPARPARATFNGRAVTRTVAAQRLLRDFLRDELGLVGTKGACEDGSAGVARSP